MTIISTRVFNGEVPRAPTDKLPDTASQQAVNCNFAYGELRPLKGLFAISTLANAAKSLFSLNGLTFASWPYKTKAWKGPVTNDTFNRYYYTSQTGGLRVSQTTLLSTNGGEPSTSYLVGVPPVTAAPTFTLVDRTTLPDYPNAAVRMFKFYESDGKRFEEAALTTFVAVKPYMEYTFTIAAPSTPTTDGSGVPTVNRTIKLSSLSYFTIDPEGARLDHTIGLYGYEAYIVNATTVTVAGETYTNVTSITPVSGPATTPGSVLGTATSQTGSSTPTTATPGVRFEVYDSVKNTTIFSLTVSGTTASRSDAVPGGVEGVLSKNGTEAGAWKLTLTYGAVDSRAYVVTMMNLWNEESKPSPAVIVSPTYMQSVRLTFTPPTLTGYVQYNRFRVYRSVGSGSYISVMDAPKAYTGTSVTFDDTLTTITNTDATLDAIGWDMPPTNLQGLTLLPNGFFAAFAGDTMYFSEPYRPWAWPYTMTFPVPLVGMRAIENSLVVTTNSYPYLVSGVHPEVMTQAQLSNSQAGISDHGMCVVGGSVAYISNDGLAVVSGYNVDLSLSQKFWTREVWRSKFGDVLSTLELAFHDGALVCGSPTAGKMWELRLDEEGGGNLTMLDNTIRADALYVLPASDQLYVVNGSQLSQYRGGSDLTYDRWSKEYILPKPINFGAGYINTDGPVTLTVYADGQQWHQQSFTKAGYFRLKGGSKRLRWSFRLQGTGSIKEVSIAETMEELKNV